MNKLLLLGLMALLSTGVVACKKGGDASKPSEAPAAAPASAPAEAPAEKSH